MPRSVSIQIFYPVIDIIDIYIKLENDHLILALMSFLLTNCATDMPLRTSLYVQTSDSIMFAP